MSTTLLSTFIASILPFSKFKNLKSVSKLKVTIKFTTGDSFTIEYRDIRTRSKIYTAQSQLSDFLETWKKEKVIHLAKATRGGTTLGESDWAWVQTMVIVGDFTWNTRTLEIEL